MNAHETLALFLRRLDLRTAQAEIFDANELKSWDSHLWDKLIQVRAMVPSSPAKAVVCDECDEGHIEPVRFIGASEHDPEGAYIECQRHGRVVVQMAGLQRWQARLDGLASVVALALGIAAVPRMVLSNRLYDLGTAEVSGVSRRIFSARGLAWPDGHVLLEQILAVAGNAAYLVLVPEKTRQSVSKGIRLAIKRIGRTLPALGNHLAYSVNTGASCVYTPEDLIPWDTQ